MTIVVMGEDEVAKVVGFGGVQFARAFEVGDGGSVFAAHVVVEADLVQDKGVAAEVGGDGLAFLVVEGCLEFEGIENEGELVHFFFIEIVANGAKQACGVAVTENAEAVVRDSRLIASTGLIGEA